MGVIFIIDYRYKFQSTQNSVSSTIGSTVRSAFCYLTNNKDTFLTDVGSNLLEGINVQSVKSM